MIFSSLQFEESLISHKMAQMGDESEDETPDNEEDGGKNFLLSDDGKDIDLRFALAFCALQTCWSVLRYHLQYILQLSWPRQCCGAAVVLRFCRLFWLASRMCGLLKVCNMLMSSWLCLLMCGLLHNTHNAHMWLHALKAAVMSVNLVYSTSEPSSWASDHDRPEPLSNV